MNNKNIILYEIIGVLLTFTVIYFLLVNKASYAFVYNEADVLYNNKMKLIEKSAELYASQNMDKLKKDETIYVTVKDLVSGGYMLADDNEGNVNNPKSDVKNLNETKIKITYKNEQLETKILN